MNKGSGGDGIPVELFEILKNNAMKVLHWICQKIWTTQQWPQDWKRSVFIPIPKKGNAKECSNFHTIALISHTSKVMLKILQARLQRMWTMNFQMFKLVLEKAEEPEIKCQHLLDPWENKRVPENDLFLLYWLHQSLWLCGWEQTMENSSRDGNTRPGIPDHFTCLLRKLYPGQEVTVRTGHGKTDWSQIGKCTSRLYIVTLLI